MPAKFSILAVVAVPLLPIIPLLACGGDDGPNVRVVDAGGGVDGRPIDAAVACTAAASYAPPAGSGNARNYPATGSAGRVMSYFAAANADPDAWGLILFAGYGGFGSGDIRPGTYTIGGDDAAFSTCGICPIVQTDVTMTGFADWYTATGGTVTLTQTGSAGGTFVGSMSNVTLKHVGKDANGLPTDTAASTCVTTIPTVTFNAAVVAGSATGKDWDAIFANNRLTHRYQ